MQNGKSRLIQAVKALREEIYGKVREQLADETRTYREVAEANLFLLLRCSGLLKVQESSDKSGHGQEPLKTWEESNEQQ